MKEKAKAQETKEDSKVKELNEKIEELTNLLKRIQADFENYKKLVEKQKSEFSCYIKQDVIKKLLPVLYWSEP